jgi:L-fuconolactonase
MFASDFPVDSLAGGFRMMFSGFSEITAGFSAAERDAPFGGSAQRLYRMPGDASLAAS